MTKKKKKKFQKKQFLSLLEKKNYQKLISKAKQFEIEGMSEDELNTILTTSYQNLAQNNFEQGDIARAVRDIDSLLQIDDDARCKLIKLKYLCYIEHFQDAIELGRELISVKNKKIQKEALFLYLMARLYSGDYELESKLLKAIPISRQRYILGFKALLEEDKALALDYFKKCNPKAKLEKENIRAIIGILSEEKAVSHPFMKPIYQFLLNGEANGVPNSKNFRTIKKEVKESFSKIEKNSDMKNLLALKTHIPIEAILKNAKDREQESRLIYNNIVLLVDKREYNHALKLFLRYRSSLVKFIESASLFMEIKSYTEDEKSNAILFSFFSSYLKRHHKKIAPHYLDYIFLFFIQQGDMKNGIKLAKIHHRDDFVFLLEEIFMIEEFNLSHQIRFNGIIKKYSVLKNTLLQLIVKNFKTANETLHLLTYEGEKGFINLLSTIIILLQNAEQPHKKYRDTIFDFLTVIALIIQTYPYEAEEAFYLKLSTVIEKYIDYFNMNRFDLSIDIKALFVSISKKESVKKLSTVENEDFFSLAERLLFEEEYDSPLEHKYNFNIEEYDLSIIKQRCIKALEEEESDPFKILSELNDFKYYRFRVFTLLEVLAKVVELKLDSNREIKQMLFYLNIKLYSSPDRDSLMTHINEHAKKDIDTAILLLEYALQNSKSQSIESVWYLKWIDGYVSLFQKYKLEKGTLFYSYIDLFLIVQGKKKFKSLNAKYKKIKKLKYKQGALL